MEVLVVVVILGVLAAVAVFAVAPIVGAGRDTAQGADAGILQSAEDAFFAHGDAGRYATQSELLAGRFLRTSSTQNSLCVKLSPGGDSFVVHGVPTDQATGDAACMTAAAAFSPPKPGVFVASAGTPAIP